jgi:hypothetical protein
MACSQKHLLDPVSMGKKTGSVIPDPDKQHCQTHFTLKHNCSARDWDGKDYLRIIPRVVW